MTTTLDSELLSIYRGAVKIHALDPGDNLALVHESLDIAIESRFVSGTFPKADMLEILKRRARQIGTKEASKNTARILAEMASGQMTIPVPEWLDLTFLAGAMRRTTVRNLEPNDTERALHERDMNARAQYKAHRRFEADAIDANALLTKYGSVPAAIAAGAIKPPKVRVTV